MANLILHITYYALCITYSVKTKDPIGSKNTSKCCHYLDAVCPPPCHLHPLEDGHHADVCQGVLLPAEVGASASLQVSGEPREVEVDTLPCQGHHCAQKGEFLESCHTKNLEAEDEHDELFIIHYWCHGESLQHGPGSKIQFNIGTKSGKVETWQQVTSPLE